jgi:hypothetical protein
MIEDAHPSCFFAMGRQVLVDTGAQRSECVSSSSKRLSREKRLLLSRLLSLCLQGCLGVVERCIFTNIQIHYDEVVLTEIEIFI